VQVSEDAKERILGFLGERGPLVREEVLSQVLHQQRHLLPV
jgi:hypothetical protein